MTINTRFDPGHRVRHEDGRTGTVVGFALHHWDNGFEWNAPRAPKPVAVNVMVRLDAPDDPMRPGRKMPAVMVTEPETEWTLGE